MPTSASVKLFALSKEAISTIVTDGGTVVEMTTVPQQVHRPDGFARTVAVTQWRRGPMHPDDASVLIRIALEHGTDSRKWTPVLPEGDQAVQSPAAPTVATRPQDDRQIDFGDLLG